MDRVHRRKLARWAAGLARATARLYAECQIPADYELHATKFAGGRGNPSLNPAWNRRTLTEPGRRTSPADDRRITTRWTRIRLSLHRRPRPPVRPRSRQPLRRTHPAPRHPPSRSRRAGLRHHRRRQPRSQLLRLTPRTEPETSTHPRGPVLSGLPPLPMGADGRPRRLRGLPAPTPPPGQALHLALVRHPPTRQGHERRTSSTLSRKEARPGTARTWAGSAEADYHARHTRSSDKACCQGQSGCLSDASLRYPPRRKLAS